MTDEKKEETKRFGNASSSSNLTDAGLFRKMPTLIDNRNGANDKSASNKSSLDISSDKEEEKKENASSSGNNDKNSHNCPAASTITSTITSIRRRQDGVLFYQVNMEFPIPQKLSSARKGDISSYYYRRRQQQQQQQCKSWMIQTATRAMWNYLLYSRGILPVPVHEILRITNNGKDHDDQHNTDVEASNNKSNNNNKNRKLYKTREALQRLEQDWNRLTAMRNLEIVQVMIVLGSSWRRPKEAHLLDFGGSNNDGSSGDLGNDNNSNNQDENDGTAAILESLQHSLSSRLIRSAMQAEGEAQQEQQQVSGAKNNNNNGTSTVGPADQMTMFISVTAKSYNDIYQKAQQQQPCEEGLLSSTLLQSLTLCRDFDLDQRAFGVPTTPTTGTTKRSRPLVPSLQRCSKTLLKLSVGPEEQQQSPRTTSTTVNATRTGGDDDDDDDLSEQQEGAGENNVLWLLLSSTVKGFSLAE